MNPYLLDLVRFSYIELSSAPHEEFSLDFSMVSAASPGVSDDCLKFDVYESHGQTCRLVYIQYKKEIMLVW